ncbi:YeeE/YedE family protein [Catenovulum sp. 2E275]|uniref:YeeE/YedE family protein n=1 Tax=Catenovulum sp. 2E275 TaxID=2980497 RepID=UPI0021D1CCBC|nr:YeeE/YedE family protein [Catenovulum sp. 2E275]MCU4674578.1 YeeE/YedE family protein [Catenovulum sp. 2E275]
MTELTLVESLIGGGLIGIAAVILLSVNGKIAGISGIFYHALINFKNQLNSIDERLWRIFFIAGLVLSPFIAVFFNAQLPEKITSSWPVLALAGFFVGLGSRLGSGCTSGHGICGIGRFSQRSIIATCVFMLTAILTVLIIKWL